MHSYRLRGMTLGLIAIAALSPLNLAQAQDGSPDLLEHEIDYLLDIWPGEYDNWQQRRLEEGWGLQDSTPPRIHVLAERLSIEGADQPAMRLTLTYPESADQAATGFIYLLESDRAGKAIDAYAYRTAVASSAALSQSELVREASCDLVIRRSGLGFSAMPGSDSCSAAPATMRILPNDLELSWASGDTSLLRRARWFDCMVDVPKEKPGVANHTQHYMQIHDQGGMFEFVHPDGRDMTVLLAHSWSFGMRRDTMFVGVLGGKGSGPTLVYSWAEPGSDRIGVNPGYVRIQCDLASPLNRELQQGLRPDS